MQEPFSLRKIKSVLPDNISISTSLHSGLGMKVAFTVILENNWKMKLTWYLKHYKDLSINNYYVGISPTPISLNVKILDVLTQKKWIK